ncbi:hypothetical protein SDC9_145669 [bioreactor metagenome]|uniref:Uncharacterized protein n=1 Tax=bioreactor metagenome TaxID=1076179 RepID=A0A645EAW7_9ZZZZ
MEMLLSAEISFFEPNRDRKETDPSESLLSKSDIGRIVILVMRPVPECEFDISSAGTKDPVRMN